MTQAVELSTELKAQALALANARAGDDDALRPLRALARAHLEETGFPGKKSEAWKYTSLRALEEGHLKNAAPAASAPTEWPDFGGFRLVFVNGRFQADQSLLPDAKGVELVRLNGERESALSDVSLSPFAWLNGAALNDGLCLRIAGGTELEKPLHVIHYGTAEEASFCQSRLRVELGENAGATVIEQYSGTGPLLVNAVTELATAKAARLLHYRLQNEAEDSLHIGSLVIEQARDSQVKSIQLMRGNRLRRNEVRALLNEPGADLQLNGVFIGKGSTHTDNQIAVEHRAPDCTSHQVYKGMAADKARAVFNGRIHIHPGAKGTSADLSNKNLLLSSHAEIDTKPELEIYNDDVQCSHGTTVGQIDKLALFYLQSRGISAATAQRMLGLGFINEILIACPHEAVAEWARPWLAEALTEAQ